MLTTASLQSTALKYFKGAGGTHMTDHEKQFYGVF